MLQTRLQGELNGVRDKAGRLCMQTLAAHNSPVVMASCGSKGSSINIAQMVALVGQQAVAGKRCQDGFVGRTTPHFPRCVGDGLLGPACRGASRLVRVPPPRRVHTWRRTRLRAYLGVLTPTWSTPSKSRIQRAVSLRLALQFHLPWRYFSLQHVNRTSTFKCFLNRRQQPCP